MIDDDLPIIDWIYVKINLPEIFQKKIFRVFFEHLESYAQSIDQAMLAGAFEELHQAAHKLKGAAANVGASRVAAICAGIEAAAAAKDEESALAFFKGLAEEIERLRQEAFSTLSGLSD